MIISDETLVLSLVIGVILGAIYLLNKAIVGIFSIKKPGVFLLDFTFAAICCMLSFIGALAMDKGHMRFWYLALEAIGAISVVFAFEPINKLKKKRAPKVALEKGSLKTKVKFKGKNRKTDKM